MTALRKSNDDEREQSRYPKQFIEHELEDMDIAHSPDEVPDAEEK